MVKNLEIGSMIEVRLDDAGIWLDQWIITTVKSISICHNTNKYALDPYIYVRVEHPKLIAFNYSMYCRQGAVKLMK
jgi:hypothetical protein